MSFWSRARDLDKTFPWSFLGVLLAVSFGLFGIYATLRTPTTEITFDVVNESNVLDVHRTVESLEVFFRGTNIQSRNENLRSLSVRLTNTGDVNIRQGDYDQGSDWGIRIGSGKLIGASVSEASSDYLREQLKKIVCSDTTVVLPKVLFDRGQRFQVDILVLHPLGALPTIVPIGKIAGTNEFRLIHSSLNAGRSSVTRFLLAAFAGPAEVQGARALGYSLVVIILLVSSFLLGEWFTSKRALRLTVRRESQLHAFPGLASVAGANVLSDVFITHGHEGLVELREALTSRLNTLVAEARLTQKYRRTAARLLPGEEGPIRIEMSTQAGPRLAVPLGWRMTELIEAMIKQGAIYRNPTSREWEVSSEFLRVLNSIIERVKA